MKPKGILGIVMVLLLALPLSGWSQDDAETKSITLTAKEVSLGKLYPGGYAAASLVVSPDGKRVAYGAQKGEKWRVVVDGQEGSEYDRIVEGGLIFSPDSKRVAYLAKKVRRCWLS